MNNLTTFTPLMRQTVGFDRFNDLFDTLINQSDERFDAYPPYNIEKSAEDQYRITLAVAGFSDTDIDVTLEGDTLSVKGNIEERAEEESTKYLHRGIATRKFERVFRLADHIEIDNAELKDGLLVITLEREIPEEKKPRMIPINGKSKNLLGTKTKKKAH